MAANVFFPNNPNREKRAQELTSDIAKFILDLSNNASNIKTLLQKLDTKVQKMYKDIQVNIPASDTKQIDFHGWTINVFKGFQPMFTIPMVSNALEKTGASLQLSQGQTGGSALTNLVGIPQWFMLESKSGGTAVPVVAIALGLSALSDVQKRDKLRNAIHSCINPRINLKKATIIIGMLYEKLLVLNDSFDMMTQLGYTKDQLDKIQLNTSTLLESEVTKVTDNTAIQQLASLDQARGSWTNEDH